MKQKAVGLTGIIFGILFLSLELFMLKMIQLLEKATGYWYDNVWKYAFQCPANIAIIITVCVIIFSATIFYTAKED